MVSETLSEKDRVKFLKVVSALATQHNEAGTVNQKEACEVAGVPFSSFHLAKRNVKRVDIDLIMPHAHLFPRDTDLSQTAFTEEIEEHNKKIMDPAPPKEENSFKMMMEKDMTKIKKKLDIADVPDLAEPSSFEKEYGEKEKPDPDHHPKANVDPEECEDKDPADDQERALFATKTPDGPTFPNLYPPKGFVNARDDIPPKAMLDSQMRNAGFDPDDFSKNQMRDAGLDPDVSRGNGQDMKFRNPTPGPVPNLADRYVPGYVDPRQEVKPEGFKIVIPNHLLPSLDKAIASVVLLGSVGMAFSWNAWIMVAGVSTIYLAMRSKK